MPTYEITVASGRDSFSIKSEDPAFIAEWFEKLKKFLEPNWNTGPKTKKEARA